jgi:hypothetical protein
MDAVFLMHVCPAMDKTASFEKSKGQMSWLNQSSVLFDSMSCKDLSGIGEED